MYEIGDKELISEWYIALWPHIFMLTPPRPLTQAKNQANLTELLILGREPALPLVMFFANFFHYDFLLVYTLGHNELIGYTPNSAPFGLRAPKNIFFGKAAGEII